MTALTAAPAFAQSTDSSSSHAPREKTFTHDEATSIIRNARKIVRQNGVSGAGRAAVRGSELGALHPRETPLGLALTK